MLKCEWKKNGEVSESGRDGIKKQIGELFVYQKLLESSWQELDQSLSPGEILRELWASWC